MHTQSSTTDPGINELFSLWDVPNGGSGLTTVLTLLFLRSMIAPRVWGKIPPKGLLNIVQGIFHTYFPTGVDVQTLLNILHSREEKTLIIIIAREEADKTNQNNSVKAVSPYQHGVQLILTVVSGWDPWEENSLWQHLIHFRDLIHKDIQPMGKKFTNWSRFQKGIQRWKDNSWTSLECLRECLQVYTNVNPESVEGQAILKSHLTSKSFPDFRRKLFNIIFYYILLFIYYFILLEIGPTMPLPSWCSQHFTCSTTSIWSLMQRKIDEQNELPAFWL